MRAHIKKWLEWRKNNLNSWPHQLLVLFKIRRSPTFESFLTTEQWDEIRQAFEKGMNSVNNELVEACKAMATEASKDLEEINNV